MRTRGAWLWLVVILGLAGASCEYRPPELPKLPVGVEVESPPHLRVVVVNVTKRPLAPSELPPLTSSGARWDYTVQFTDLVGIAVQFREVQATVRSLTGITATRTTPLPSRVEPQGTTPIVIDASLSTSNPERPGSLTGIQELVFLAQDDSGRPVRVFVRVPLE
jgi:hypothetical protein